MEGAQPIAAAAAAEGGTGTTVWAATSSWRGDLKLFGRIAEKAIDLVEGADCPAPCRIEFSIRDDVERYDSVPKMSRKVPGSTIRSFAAARIRVGSAALWIDVCFGRKRHPPVDLACPRGVSVEVSSDGTIDEDSLESIREALLTVVARGGFPWGRPPAHGPDAEDPSLPETLRELHAYRRAVTQLAFAGVGLLLLGIGLLVYRLVEAGAGGGASLPPIPDPLVFSIAVLVFAQLILLPLSPLIFPAIEIADLTPGRRILQVAGRSGILTAAVGVAVKVVAG
ncbi:MAG TPA: hypothetical protein VNB59_00865 [Solirubrobacterales bacterium]|jgi:hypothetical protein|nr:hypothetical protein [Solirubrobacterales bacterium]